MKISYTLLATTLFATSALAETLNWCGLYLDRLWSPNGAPGPVIEACLLKQSVPVI